MQTRRWLNPSLSQTLQIAVILLYLTGAFALLFDVDPGTGYLLVSGLHLSAISGLFRVFMAALCIGAGYGIANERKWAYYLGVAAAALPLLGDLLYCIRYSVSPLRLDLITLLFQVGMFVVLVHPQSREYQRIWFK